jgi:hypothetical protein
MSVQTAYNIPRMIGPFISFPLENTRQCGRIA